MTLTRLMICGQFRIIASDRWFLFKTSGNRKLGNGRLRRRAVKGRVHKSWRATQ